MVIDDLDYVYVHASWRTRRRNTTSSSTASAPSTHPRSGSEPVPLARPRGGDGCPDVVLCSDHRAAGARTGPARRALALAPPGRPRCRQPLEREAVGSAALVSL